VTDLDVSPHPSRLHLAAPADVDEFVTALAAFERGELTADDWRKFRRLRGVYDQRQDGRSMIRVKVPGGAITSAQLRTVADVAARHAGGIAHVTTRQCFQLHFVPSGEVDAALAALAAGGLTTREACGDSVRNVTTCPLAGSAPTSRSTCRPTSTRWSATSCAGRGRRGCRASSSRRSAAAAATTAHRRSSTTSGCSRPPPPTARPASG
jgi:sulfite reductase beta subunit-like hemoprotein